MHYGLKLYREGRLNRLSSFLGFSNRPREMADALRCSAQRGRLQCGTALRSVAAASYAKSGVSIQSTARRWTAFDEHYHREITHQ